MSPSYSKLVSKIIIIRNLRLRMQSPMSKNHLGKQIHYHSAKQATNGRENFFKLVISNW